MVIRNQEHTIGDDKKEDGRDGVRSSGGKAYARAVIRVENWQERWRKK